VQPRYALPALDRSRSVIDAPRLARLAHRVLCLLNASRAAINIHSRSWQPTFGVLPNRIPFLSDPQGIAAVAHRPRTFYGD
jgi:hypothetical protein